MRTTHLTVIALTVCAMGLAAPAVELAPPGAVIPYGKTADYAIQAPTGYRSVRLTLAIRMDSPQCSGSTHSLRLALNGKPVFAALDRSHARLLNKPLTAKMASGLEVPWAREGDWRVVYAPDFEIVGTDRAGSSRILDVSPYELVLDVTDLVTPGAGNTLALDHRGEAMHLRTYFPDLNPTLDFVLNKLQVEFSPEPPVGGAAATGEAFSADRLMVQPPATVQARDAVRVSPGGGMTVALDGLPVQVLSRFSYQGGGFNTLAPAGKPAGQPEWRVQVKPAADRTVIRGTAKEYTLERTVRFAGDHVEVADKLTNLTDEAIGLAFDNRLTTPGDEITTAWLGGNPDPASNLNPGLENTTAFVNGTRSGCGLLAQDDVYRIQAATYWDQGAGIRSDSFALAPRATYTVRWSLYPVARADYYDFINLARRDLGVNFTVAGGFQFGLSAASEEACAEMAAQRGLKFMSSGVWFNREGPIKCYHGEHMLQATALQQNLRERCAMIRRATPEVKSLIYIHAFINTDPEGPRKHPDARITLADGTQYENKGYTASCGIPFLYNYPALEPENSYVAALKRVIDMCLDRNQIGADGIYWDELDWISTKYTYDRWDGHSAELDDQHRIKAKRSYVHLLARDAKVALIDYISSKGGLLIANSAPTSETLTKLHFPRFVETASGWFPARAHLYTPLSLGDHLTVKDFPGLLKDIREKLMWGSLYYYYTTPKQPYPTITQHMFPFTPVELHHGWLLGQERILTAVPGTFTLGDAHQVRVYWYDAAGKLTDQQGEQRVEQGRRLVRLALGEGEMAAVVRE
ncbi:MAG: hypothetical protein KKI08_01975 [Armatimonadetes bacterium]|nr:hypothetical protein [Armatimonadota bacterium]